MSVLRALFWLAVGAAVAVAGWLLIAPPVSPPSVEWEVAGASPRLVGDPTDPFAYAGGALVRPVSGSAVVRITDEGGAVHLSIESSEPSPPLSMLDGSGVGRSWDLHSDIDGSADLSFETLVHGDTGLGEKRLPETAARLAGESRFDLTVDGNRQPTGLSGFWSVADALRQDDGSIRQQGLVFSPLLRDRSGFSDPSRLELTLLLYEDGPGSDVLLHLVFSDVVVEAAPHRP